MSLLFSKLVGEGGKVHAFEPSVFTNGLLAHNVALNGCGNIVLHRKAVSDSIGETVDKAGCDSCELLRAALVLKAELREYLIADNVREADFPRPDLLQERALSADEQQLLDEYLATREVKEQK